MSNADFVAVVVSILMLESSVIVVHSSDLKPVEHEIPAAFVFIASMN